MGALVAVGRTSDVHEFGRGSVVKVPRPGVPPHWAGEEARFTAAVRELGAPAPAVLDLVDVAGREAIVFDRVVGRSMWDLIVDSPRETAAWGRELAGIHRHILSAGLPARVGGLVERMEARSKPQCRSPTTNGERRSPCSAGCRGAARCCTATCTRATC
ncbi:MAG: phosphotransferase [Acidimicrobiales bacterium]